MAIASVRLAWRHGAVETGRGARGRRAWGAISRPSPLHEKRAGQRLVGRRLSPRGISREDRPMSGLLGSTLLDVLIGLFFIYLLLSVICSSIQELLAGFLKLRARDLERGIMNLLCDDQVARA